MEVSHRVLVGRITRALRRTSTGHSQHFAEGPDTATPGTCRRWNTDPIPVPVDCSLTDYGRSLLPLLEDARFWGRAHIERLASQIDGPGTSPGTNPTNS